MRIAVLGGTGKMGSALASRLAERHSVMVGSRDRGRAEAAASDIKGATGGTNLEASKYCEAAFFALPFSAIGEARSLREPLSGKLVLSLMNPMRLREGTLEFGLREGSAAEQLAAILTGSRVATAFNNIPVSSLRPGAKMPMDILIAAQSREAYEEAARLVRDIPRLRPLYAGPLSHAGTVERLTPLVLNLAKWNGTGSLATRFTSEKD